MGWKEMKKPRFEMLRGETGTGIKTLQVAARWKAPVKESSNVVEMGASTQVFYTGALDGPALDKMIVAGFEQVVDEYLSWRKGYEDDRG
ncbi:MAG: hypothetical protein ABFR89_02415 [Actinomycetota bacterium]